MLNNFYSISINDDRYNYQCKLFQKVGLPIPTKYCGFKDDVKKELCCLFGHMSLIMIARNMNLPYIFIFEDDAYPRVDCVERMNFYIDKRPTDCGCIVFGRNGESGEISRYENFHIVEQRPFGAHAYMIYQNCYDDMLKSMEKTRIADIALRGNNFIKFKPYWTNENLFIQENIDNNCMSKNLVSKHGKYFYPSESGGLGVFDHLPNDPKWII